MAAQGTALLSVILCQLHASCGTNLQQVTCAGTQYGFHTAAEGAEPVQRHKCLDCAGKAAAVDPACAFTVQQLSTQRQRHADRLLPGIAAVKDVLQQGFGGSAGFRHEG